MLRKWGGPTPTSRNQADVAPQVADLRDLLARAIHDVDARLKQAPSRKFRFGDIPVAVRVDGSGLTRDLLRMIDARRSAEVQTPWLIDVVGAGMDRHEDLLPAPAARGKAVLRASQDIYYLWLDEAGGYLTAIDRVARRGIVWFTAPDRIASWHTARPFLHAIKGVSLATPWTPVHAAAVALNGKGVVVVGQSGAGKTSIAIACALAGWDYLGDDAVILRANPAEVGAIYNSARLRSDMFDVFPEAMAASLGISDDAGEAKAEIDMALLHRCDRDGAEVGAIIVPQRSGGSRIGFAPMSRPDAVRTLMAATRQSIMGDDHATFDKLATLVRTVPCYVFDPGRDPSAVPAALGRLLQGDMAP